MTLSPFEASPPRCVRDTLDLRSVRPDAKPRPLQGKRADFLPRLDVAVGHGLLNAHRIQLRIGDERLQYIASAHPKHVGWDVYAKLLWDDEARCVVALEPSKLLGAPGSTQVVGDYTFRTLSQTSVADGAARLRQGELSHRGQTRPFTVLETTGWYDGTALDADVLRTLIAEARRYGQATVAVHCAAGLGRTGTFLAGSLLAPLKKAHPKATPRQLVHRAINIIRFHRDGSVETPGQVQALHALAGDAAPTATDAPPTAAAMPPMDWLDTPVTLSVSAARERDGRFGAWVAPSAPQAGGRFGYLANRAVRWALAPVDFLLFGGGTPLLKRPVPLLGALYREGVLRSVALGLGACARQVGALVGLLVGLTAEVVNCGEDFGVEEDGVVGAGALIGSRLLAAPFEGAALLGTYLTAPIKAAAFLAGRAVDRLMDRSDSVEAPLVARATTAPPAEGDDAPLV